MGIKTSFANTIWSRAWQQQSTAPLASFRILFGMLMVWATVRFAARGWIATNYLEPSFHFTFPGFSWVHVLPAGGMYVVFIVQGLAALALAMGWRTRWAAGCLALCFTYVELLDKSYYLNHYYFVSLVSVLLIFLPAGGRLSWDARRGRGQSHAPAWVLALLPIQIGMVYFFAGLAKLDPDWWHLAEPLKTWLPAQAHQPVIGPLLAFPATAYVMSWLGLLFDLSIPFALAWRRTRPFALMAALGFHALTGWLWPIGMFPWLMSAAILIFLPAAWHERIQARLSRPFAGLLQYLGILPKRPTNTLSPLDPAQKSEANAGRGQLARLGFVLAACWLLVQLAIPLRTHTYPGDLLWTEAGYRFSWRVMLMEKAGYTGFRVIEPATGRTEYVRASDHLSPLQEKMMATQPDMIRQFAVHLEKVYAERGVSSPTVYADAWVRLNGRPSTRFVQPDIDLASLPNTIARRHWLMPSPRELPPTEPKQAATSFAGL